MPEPIMSPSLTLALPVILAVLGGAACLLFDAFARPRTAVAASALGLTAGAIAAGVVVVDGLVNEIAFLDIAYDMFVVGGGFSFLHFVILAIGAIILWAALPVLSETSRGPGQAALLAFTAAASVLLLGALDILTVLLAFEIIAITGYALVAAGGSGAADEAAIKYLVQGALAAAMFVMGLAIMFGLYGGVTDVRILSSFLQQESSEPALAAMVLLFAAFIFKLGGFPFHSWAPDAYETIRPEVGAFVATAPKVSAMSALFMIFFRSFSLDGLPLDALFGAGALGERMVWLVAAVAAMSIVFGNTAALRQSSYTRMLAYSGIAQVGYAVSAMVLSGRAMFHSVFMMVAYAIAAAGAFLVAAAVYRYRSDWDGSIRGLAGIGRERPLLGFSLAVLMFSLTGIPMTAGFMGKYLVFAALAVNGWTWLAILGAIGSAVSFGYYGSVLRWAFFEDAPADETAEMPQDSTLESPCNALTWGATVFVALTLLIGCQPLLMSLDIAARLLDLGFGA